MTFRPPTDVLLISLEAIYFQFTIGALHWSLKRIYLFIYLSIYLFICFFLFIYLFID